MPLAKTLEPEERLQVADRRAKSSAPRWVDITPAKGNRESRLAV